MRKLNVGPMMVAMLVTALAVACGEGVYEPQPPAAVQSAVVTAGANPLVRDLSVELDGPSAIQVDYWTVGRPSLRKTTARGAPSHTLLLTRLIPDAEYDFEVRGVSADGLAGAPYRGRFTTGSLPDDLAAVQFKTVGRTTEPLIMVQLGGVFEGWAILNEEGDVVWFYRANPAPSGYTQRQNKNFVFNQGEGGGRGRGERVTEVDARGHTVHELVTPSTSPHHDVIPTPRNTVLYLGRETRTIDDTAWIGDAIFEWDPETGEHTKRWTTFDQMSPQTDLGDRSNPGDWTHANAIAIGPRGNIIVSLFFLRQVLSVAPDFGSIEWRMYGPRASITALGAAVAYGTHTAAEIAPNRILMFDNGVDRPEGGYSRALEVEIDPETDTAMKVWDFRAPSDNHSLIISSARRLPNGNTMVGFGARQGLAGSSGPIEAYEVTQSGRAVWHMVVQGAGNMYRAIPLADIKNEVEVAD